MTESTIGSRRAVCRFAITLSAMNFVENGRTSPHRRLMAMSKKPPSKSAFLGCNKAQISGSAFQVSAALFLGLAGLAASIDGAVMVVGRDDMQSQFLGSPNFLVK